MNYRKLSDFRSTFSEFGFPLKPADTDAFRTVLYQRMPGEVFENEFWINTLSSDSGILFMGWTDQSDELTRLLRTKELEKPFSDAHNIRKHTFFRNYQAFITPFLYPVLDTAARQSPMEKWEAGLTFASLLEETRSGDIEGIIYRQLQEEQEQFERKAARADNEEALVKAVQPYLKPSFISILNAFSPAYYRARSNWMDALLGVADSPHSSRRLILHIARQLEPLEMSSAHREELNQYNKNVRSGAVEIDKPEVNWKRIIFSTIGIAGAVALVWFIWRVPSKVEDKKENQDFKTSYMAFSPEERASMDSLLQLASTNQEQEQFQEIDGEELASVDIDLILKEPWKNKTADKLLNRWSQADTTNNRPDTKLSVKDGRSYPATQHLAQKKTGEAAILNNTTDISVFVMVFANENGGSVYTAYVEKKTALNFKMNDGEYLVVLPGSSAGKPVFGQLPFEQVDRRFFENLNEAYRFVARPGQTAKFVWKELNSSDYFLLDVNNNLTK